MPTYIVELEDGRELEVEADTPPTSEDLTQYFAAQNAPQAQAAKKDLPFGDITDVASALGQAASSSLTTVPASFRQMYEGPMNPWKKSAESLESRKAMQRVAQESEAAQAEAEASGDASVMGRAIRSGIPSYGFTGAILPVSVAAGGVAGLGTGLVSKNPVAAQRAAMAAGSAASGVAAYRMAASQFMDDARERIDNFFLEKAGRLPNKQEQDEAYQELLPLAQEMGMAEALPEAFGNLALAGAGKYIYRILGGKTGVQQLASGALSKARGLNAAKALGAGAASTGVEVGTEGLTEMLNEDTMKKLEEGVMRGEDVSTVQTEPYSMKRLGESIEKVAEPTLATTGIFGLLGAGGGMAYRAATKQNLTESDFRDKMERQLQASQIGLADPEATAANKSIYGEKAEEAAAALKALDEGRTSDVEKFFNVRFKPSEAIAEEPSMLDPVEVTNSLNTASVQDLANADSPLAAAAEDKFTKVVEEIVKSTEPTVQPVETAKAPTPEVTPYEPTTATQPEILPENLPNLEGEPFSEAEEPVSEEVIQPTTPPQNAPDQIPLEESLRQEPQDRVEGGEAEGPIVSDSVFSPAEGEEEVGLARYEEALAAGLDQRTASGLGAAAEIGAMLREMRNRTPEQVRAERIQMFSEDAARPNGTTLSGTVRQTFFPEGGQEAILRPAKKGGYEVVAGGPTWAPPGEKPSPQVKKGKVLATYPSIESFVDAVYGVSLPITQTGEPTPTPEGTITPATERDLTKPEQPFSVYQMNRNGEQKWMVQSGEKRGFGDYIFDTQAEAEKFAVTEKTRQQERAEAAMRAEQKKRDEETAKTQREQKVSDYAASIGATPLVVGKLKKTLMEPVAKRTGGKVYEGTRAEVVEQLLASGFSPTSAQVDAIKDLTGRQMNRMDNREQAAYEKRKREAGQKTEYRLENAEGNRFEVTKAEHDFAKWLESQPKTGSTPSTKLLSERAVRARIEDSDPIPAAAVDTYGIKLPEGYVKQGDLYVFQPGATGEPVQAAPSAAQVVKATAPGPVFQRVASEMDTMSLKDLSEYAEQQGMPRKEAVGFARDYIAKWANQIVDKANGLFGRSIKLGFFPSKISKDGMRIVASGRGLSHKHGIEVDDSQSPLHAAWVAAHEFAHQIFPTAFLPNEASLAKGDHPKGLDDIKSKSKSEKLASDFANWLVSKEYPEHSDSIPSIPSGMRDYFESLIQPQTTAAEKQTPAPSAKGAGAAGVGSNLAGGRSSELQPSETQETQPSTKENDAIAKIDRLVSSGAKPEEMDKFVKSLSDADFNSLIESEAFDVDKKLAIKPKDTYDAKRIKRRKFVDQINATAVQARKTADQIFKEEEAELAKEIKKGEEVRRARKSVIDPAKTNIEYDKVTTAIVEAARRQLQNSGEIPNAILTRIYASPEAFLADRSNQRYFPAAYARIMAEPNVEGLYADKTTFVFASNVGVSDLDRGIAEARGISEEQAAARRVIAHENGHRGVDLFEPWELREFRSFVNRTYTTEEIDNLVRLYTEFADWRTNPVSRNEALEEIFQKKFERLVKIPTGGIWDDIVQFLKRVWRRLTGRTDDPTLDNMKDVVRLLRNAMRRTAVPSYTTKDGGEVKLSYAGEKAIENLPEERRQFMRDSLDTAKAMAAAGKDSEEIRAVTGWFPGKYDGKMRWELPDDGVRLRLEEFRQARSNGDSPQDVVRKFFSDRQSKEQGEAMRAIKGMPKDELLKFSRDFTEKQKRQNASLYEFFIKGDNRERGRIPMGYLLDHNALFEAYPELFWTPISFNAEDVGFDAAGQANADGSIGLNPAVAFSDEVSALSTLLHEAQHLIQQQEGFAKGSSVNQAAMRQGWDYYDESQAITDYQRTAGEIEARDVQARQKLTPEQRKATAPYSSENIAKEDAIVMFGGKASKPEYASDYSAASSAGAQLARDTVYDDRIIEMRDAIRRAYEQSSTEAGVAMPLDELYAKAKELAPDMTENEFGNILQDLYEDNGAVLQEGDIKPTLTEEDRRYLDLAEDEEGNQEELQAMVDEAAKEAGFAAKLFHGTTATEDVLIQGRRPKDSAAEAEKGLRQIAEKYGVSEWRYTDAYPRMLAANYMGITQQEVDAALKLKRAYLDAMEDATPDTNEKRIAFNVFNMPSGEQEFGVHVGNEGAASMFGEVFPFWVKLGKQIRLPDLGVWGYQAVIRELRKKGVRFSEAEYDLVFNSSDPNQVLRQMLRDKGFESVVYRNEAEGRGDSYILTSPSQIKSADPVTRDDQGNIIPLSRRFDTGPDIRGQINVFTPEGRRAGFAIIMPKRAVASRVETEGPSVDEYKKKIEAINSNSLNAFFGGVQMKGASPQVRTVKPSKSYEQAAIELVNDLTKDGTPIEDIAESLFSEEFLQGLGIKLDIPALVSLIAEVKNRVSNQSRDDKIPGARRIKLQKLDRKLAGYWQDLGTNSGRSQGIRSYITRNPRYRWMFIFDKAEEQLRKDRELAATRVASDLPQTADNLQRTDAKAGEDAGEQVADDLEDNQDAIDLAEGEATLDQKGKTLWEKFKDLIRKRGIAMRALNALRAGNKAKASISSEERNTISQMSEEELVKFIAGIDKEMAGVFDEFTKAPATRKKRKKMVATSKKRAEQGKPIEPKQSAAKEKLSGAERTAQNILKDLSERYADPNIYTDAKRAKINEMRELYKKRVRQGVGPEQMSEQDFVSKAVSLGANKLTAETLWKAAELEIEAREAMRQEEVLGKLTLEKIQREISALRPGEQTPFSKTIPWRKLLSQKAATVKIYRQRIFDTISSEESFADLDDAQKAKLADLLTKAWESKREAILDGMVKNAINQEQAAGRLTKEGADALRSQRQKLVEDINLGILDEDRLMKHLADKFGIKSEFTEAERANIDRLLDILQDDKLNEVKRNKAAYELLEALSASTKIPFVKWLADLWVTAVLSGLNTAASIAMAVANGGFELTVGVFRVLRAGFTNPKEVPAEIEASFKAMYEFLKAFGREGRLAWQYLVTGDRALLDPSLHNFRNDLNYDSIGKTVSLAEKMAKSDKVLEKVMGIWMRSVSRLLSALDNFNTGVTKAGALPIVFRQLNLSGEDLQRAAEKYNLKLYREKAIQEDFGNKQPTNQHEKALVDSYAKARMMADLQEFGKFSENADFIAQNGAMTLDPTGVGGAIYSGIKYLTGGATTKADKFLADAQREWNQVDGADKTAKGLQLAFAYIRQFVAYNSANLAGLRFARFAGNKFNQGLSFIPGIGMFRMYEATVKDSKIEAKDAFTDMIMRNQLAGLLLSLTGFAVIQAITDEPDDEKRGWFINGGWANLTPDRKQQKLAAGQKEYTIGIGGKVYNYQNWPISPIMAAIGSLSDLIRFSPEQWNEKSVADRLLSAAASGVFSAGEIPALSGFQTLFGNNLSSKDPNEKRLDRFAKVMAGWGGGFVPRILKDIDFMTDPGLRKYETLWEQTASHIPVYRRYSGEEYYDILGKQIERKVWPGSREFMELETAPEYRTLGKLNSRGIWLTPANAEHRMVGKGRNKRKLTQEEADAYSLETGKGYRQMLLRYGSRLEQMPTERARAFLMDKADEVRDRALKKIVR